MIISESLVSSGYYAVGSLGTAHRFRSPRVVR